MRSTCRSFVAAILLIAVAGVALAQDASPAPPPPQNSMGMGAWFLAGVALVLLAGIISMIVRRKAKTETAIVDFTTISPELKPAPAPRP
jgi:uncharacterized membrane protein